MEIRSYLENINILWSHLICEELIRLGVSHAFISPGYRNVPLMFALHAQKGVTLHTCIDERSAAYRALGCVKASGRPALIVCTSGTAGANYFPAIIEAQKEQLPLIAVTADRPFEMIHTGANQVIEQPGLFGRFVRLSLALPVPSREYAPRMVLAHAAHLMEQALTTPRGPVHLNIPFREPLEPALGAGTSVINGDISMQAYIAEALDALEKRRAAPQPSLRRSARMGADQALALHAHLMQSLRPLLILGRLDSTENIAKIERFSVQLGWPVYCDIGSSLRGHAPGREIMDAGIGAMETLLLEYHPDTLLHLGRRLVSKHFDAYITGRHDLSYHVVNPLTDIQDTSGRAACHWTMDEGDFVDQISVAGCCGEARPDEPAIAGFLAKTRKLCANLGRQTSEGPLSMHRIAALVAEHIQADSLLFLGNSAAIRAFDRSLCGGSMAERRIRVHANRGVSGIEGLLSTAIGLATGAEGQSVTAVVGDISMLHDLNALATLGVHRHLPLVVIIANDQGGGIFRAMPAAEFPHIAPYLQTPHTLEFGAVARMADIPYARVETCPQLIEAYTSMAAHGTSGIVECLFAP